jgi:hypothetical protein
MPKNILKISGKCAVFLTIINLNTNPSFCPIITVVDQWKYYLRKLRLEKKSAKIVCLGFKEPF